MDKQPLGFNVQCGHWNFELKRIQGRKCESYGEPFEAALSISISGQVATIEAAISKTEFLKSDYQEIRGFLMALGFHKKNIRFERVKNNQVLKRNAL